jgi:uncharacterized protein YuzE
MIVEISSSGAAYIRYATGVSVSNVYVGEGESADVIVDLDESSRVLGIELLDATSESDIALARAFALERSLPFPRDLAAAARDISVA